MHSDRRQHERIPQKIKFDLHSDEMIHHAESVNLSLNGVYCKINEPVAFMSRVKLTLSLPTGTVPESAEKIECRGVVVRTDQIEKLSNQNGDNNMAIFFDEIGDKEQHKLAAYLNRHH